MSKKRLPLVALAPATFVLLCVAVGLPLNNYPQYVIAVTLISMVVGVALVVLVGLARCITLASGSIMAIGAYVSALTMLHLGLPFLLALLLAGAAGALAGWLIALPGTRFRGHNLAMVTLVFQSVCIILIREAKSLTGGAEGMYVPQVTIFGWRIANDADFLVLIGSISTLVILLLSILIRGPFGKNLRATASNEVAAEAYGISVPGYLTAAFIVSSIAISIAGAIAAPRIRIIDPDSFGVIASIFMLAYPLVGGMSSIWGGIMGGGTLRILPELLRPVADFQELFFASLVIVVVMFFSGGLVELMRRGAMLVWGTRAKTVPKTEARNPAAVASVVPVAPVSPTPPQDSSEALLRVTGVDKHFDALHAVNSANLIVPVGGIQGLIGPNGAGKTSLFNIISGFLEADTGKVEFAGTSLLELRARDRIRFGITRTFQHVAVFGELSCVDNAIIGLGQNRVMSSIEQSFDYFVLGSYYKNARQKALHALEAVGLADVANSPAAALSLGNQRRLEIARAIVSDPQLILLDEPVSGVSEAEMEELLQLLLHINAERKIAMLIVEHNIPFVAKLCRSMAVMGAGRIVAEGNPKDVIAMPMVRQLYFGEEEAA